MANLKIRLLLCLFVSIISHVLILSAGLFETPLPEIRKVSTLHTRIVPLSVVTIHTTEESATTFQENENNGAASEDMADSEPITIKKVLPPAGAISLIAPKLENYLPVSMLTKVPSPIDSIDPTPPEFMLNGLLGEIEFILLISADGDIDDVLVVSSNLPEPIIEFAKSAFRKSRFTPGFVQETAVRSRLRIRLSPNPLSVDPETGNPLSAKNRRR